MKSTNYSEKVMEHFRNPKNRGRLLGDDVAWGRIGNPVCGDLMDIYIRVEDNIIKDIKFETFGCGSAVATSSMITEMAKGKTLDEAYKLTRKDVAEELDGLPPIKMHCSNLAADALKKAIDNYRAGFRVGNRYPDDPDVEEASYATVSIATKLETPIKGIEDYIGKGVYTKRSDVQDIEKFRDQRVLIVYDGDKTVQLALDLLSVTDRVILMTKATKISTKEPELKKALKQSDVKIIYQAELIEIMGEGEVEKVKVHDLDEDDEYELFVDVVINFE